MPPSALEQLTRLNIEYPMIFKLTNKKTKRSTHCGVLEFVADEGKVYLPHWVRNKLLFILDTAFCTDFINLLLTMFFFVLNNIQMMANMVMEEGALLQIESVSLPVATFSKFKPLSEDFLDISNPKAGMYSRFPFRYK